MTPAYLTKYADDVDRWNAEAVRRRENCEACRAEHELGARPGFLHTAKCEEAHR